jgi:MFS family permease
MMESKDGIKERLAQPYQQTPDPDASAFDVALDEIGYGLYQRRLLWLTACTQLADAMELMVISFLSLKSVWCRTAWHGDTGAIDSISTAVFSGMLVGAFTTGRISDIFGRRAGVIVTTALAGVGGLVCSFSQEIWQLLVLRFLVGMGVGGSPAALALFTEFLPQERRGTQLILFLLFFSIGTVLESLIAWATLSSSWGWRGMLVVSAIPSLVLLCATPWLPESPRYLLVRGKHTQVKQLLQEVARVNGTSISPETLAALDAEQRSSEGSAGESGGGVQEDRGNHGLRQLMSSELRLSTLLLCALFFLMAYVYYGLVLLTPTLITLSGNSTGSADGCKPPTNLDYLGSVVVSAGELPGLAIAAFLLERVGRRSTICRYSASYTVLHTHYTICSCFVATGLLMLVLIVAQSMYKWLAVFTLFLARASSLAFNQSLWVYTVEIYPTALRVTGLGVTTCFARLGGISTSQSLAPLFEVSQSGTLGVCCAGCFLAALLTMGLPRDTLHSPLSDWA